MWRRNHMNSARSSETGNFRRRRSKVKGPISKVEAGRLANTCSPIRIPPYNTLENACSPPDVRSVHSGRPDFPRAHDRSARRKRSCRFLCPRFFGRRPASPRQMSDRPQRPLPVPRSISRHVPPPRRERRLLRRGPIPRGTLADGNPRGHNLASAGAPRDRRRP